MPAVVLSALLAAFSLPFTVAAATFAVDAAEGAADVPASLAVGNTIDLTLPGGRGMSLAIVASPPPGIAGRSYIARDAQGQSSAVVKPTNDGLRVTIDDFEHHKIYSVVVVNGDVETSVRDISGIEGDVCGTCGGDLAAPPATWPRRLRSGCLRQQMSHLPRRRARHV